IEQLSKQRENSGPILALGELARAIHEAAEKIFEKKITIPDDLQETYADFYRDRLRPAHVPPLGASFYDLFFSELRVSPMTETLLRREREVFSEEDIESTIANKRLLAGVDAYGKGLITLGDVKERVFGNANFNPSELSFNAFRLLCIEIVNRIHRGIIVVPESYEVEFQDLYRPDAQR